MFARVLRATLLLPLLSSALLRPSRVGTLRTARGSSLLDLSSLDGSLLSVPLEDILRTAASKAVSGGTAGASASALQVFSLMWMRTALNYQYRAGVGTVEALRTLYREGGVARLYQGLPFALVQGPLSRFGDTASNALVLSLMEGLDPSGAVPGYLRTLLASGGAGAFRVLLMPIDTAKTCMQVNGAGGLRRLGERVAAEGPGVLFAGSLATVVATAVGHYPWFLTFNFLTDALPSAEQMHAAALALAQLPSSSLSPEQQLQLWTGAQDPRLLDVARSALVGLAATCVSDTCSNSIRVLKTYRQSSETDVSYWASVQAIVADKGWSSLFGRGLQTRLLANSVQGMLFSVLFKYFQSKH